MYYLTILDTGSPKWVLQAKLKAMFLLEVLGNLSAYPFRLLEAAHIPWLVVSNHITTSGSFSASIIMLPSI